MPDNEPDDHQPAEESTFQLYLGLLVFKNPARPQQRHGDWEFWTYEELDNALSIVKWSESKIIWAKRKWKRTNSTAPWQIGVVLCTRQRNWRFHVAVRFWNWFSREQRGSVATGIQAWQLLIAII